VGGVVVLPRRSGIRPSGQAIPVKGRSKAAAILTRSVLAFGCAPRAASGGSPDRA